jgi:hypothetical protein
MALDLRQLCQEDALDTFHPNAGMVHGVAYSPDGKSLAATYEVGTVNLWVPGITKGPVATLLSNPGWKPPLSRGFPGVFPRRQHAGGEQ